MNSLKVRMFGVAEVTVVLALFLYLKKFLKSSGFGDWQESVFGATVFSSTLLFFILPLIFILMSGRNPGACGFTANKMKYYLRVAFRAISFVLPATVLFPLIGMLGYSHKEWMGAAILGLGFGVAGVLLADKSQNLPNAAQEEQSWGGFPVYVALLVIGLLLCYLFHPLSQLANRLVTVLIFVAFLEEFFFRGYVQSRLNDCFGKPFSFRKVEFGAGLLITAVVFGLFHPLTAADETPWAWALWTAAGGLVFGFVREKTGSVVSSAILHGVILLPAVFFSPA